MNTGSQRSICIDRMRDQYAKFVVTLGYEDWLDEFFIQFCSLYFVQYHIAFTFEFIAFINNFHSVICLF